MSKIVYIIVSTDKESKVQQFKYVPWSGLYHWKGNTNYKGYTPEELLNLYGE